MRKKIKKHGWSWVVGAALAGLLCARCAQTVHHVGADAARVKADMRDDNGPKVFPNLFKSHY